MASIFVPPVIPPKGVKRTVKGINIILVKQKLDLEQKRKQLAGISRQINAQKAKISKASVDAQRPGNQWAYSIEHGIQRKLIPKLRELDGAQKDLPGEIETVEKNIDLLKAELEEAMLGEHRSEAKVSY